MEHQSAAGSGGIDPLGKGAERNVPALEGLHCIDQVQHGPGQTATLRSQVTFLNENSRLSANCVNIAQESRKFTSASLKSPPTKPLLHC